MPEYTKDRGTGIIHVVDPTGGGEHTLCGYAHVDGGDAGSVDGEPSQGPYTCEDCKNDVAALRAVFKYLKFQ